LAPRTGSLDVAVVHRRLGRGQVPFVLLVDGCLEDPSFADARQRLGIIVDARGGGPIYVGPGDAGTALRQQSPKLQPYLQDFPWLRSRNPTVLGATPGTAAYGEANPPGRYGWASCPAFIRCGRSNALEFGSSKSDPHLEFLSRQAVDRS